ncbi:MAG: M48 family metallopeptidase [Aminobacterium sp.]|jgi:putative metalloprotease|uniref:M48 family metallopeptidase n=1 Tax=Aminobacterium sp. TaxID=1872491 RepID=UPI002B1ED59C|nr:M48 family metallopeptidase [Aminobacterium sp.]MEA4877246.1 M48 family metallopeptidase [Aminobacterium sp.]
MKKHLTVTTVLITVVLCLFAEAAQAALSPQQLERAWKRISEAAGIETTSITIEDKKEPNAWVRFSGSDHAVYVTTGLLKILNKEDEIAGILGHETGHIQLNHYGSTIGRNLLWALLFKNVKGDRNSELLASLGVGLAESGFSREQEIEADDYGIKLSVKAGYSAWGLVNALEKMRDAGYETSPSGFNSHPPTERRLQHIRATARTYSQQ